MRESWPHTGCLNVRKEVYIMSEFEYSPRRGSCISRAKPPCPPYSRVRISAHHPSTIPLQPALQKARARIITPPPLIDRLRLVLLGAGHTRPSGNKSGREFTAGWRTFSFRIVAIHCRVESGAGGVPLCSPPHALRPRFTTTTTQRGAGFDFFTPSFRSLYLLVSSKTGGRSRTQLVLRYRAQIRGISPVGGLGRGGGNCSTSPRCPSCDTL